MSPSPTPSRRPGRPPQAYGIWPAMLEAAGGPAAFCRATGLPDRTVSRVWQGLVVPRAPVREACLAFAQAHAIRSRAFMAPSGSGFLVSAPDGWFLVEDSPGAWASRVPTRRRRGEDWSGLDALELDWPLFWRKVGGIS